MHGERLKIARKKAKLSQEEVAEMINTSRSNISKYETEALEPNIETLKQLCKIYKVSADYIVGLTEENENNNKGNNINNNGIIGTVNM